MEQVNIYAYYSFGYNYRLLITHPYATNKQAFTSLEKYFAFVTKLNLKVTLSSIKHVELDDDFTTLKKLARAKSTSTKPLDKTLWSSIIQKINKIDIALDSELKLKNAYVLDDKRYDNEILLENIYKIFSKDTFILLPPVAKSDFEESGKCLAFDRYTACAFHSLRGTEDVLKYYYEKILSLTATDKDTWGTFETAIVNAITKGILNPKPEEQLIINIGSLRKYYRNKTQHPQNTYSSDEAQDLFSLCIKTVNELIADLRNRKLI